MERKVYQFCTEITPVPDKGGAYVRFPYDIRKEFGKGRVKAEITFDGVPYCGSIVNMGVKNQDGSICYIIGIRKDIQKKIGKYPGDNVTVTVSVLESAPETEKTVPATIEEYILRQPEQIQPYLHQINQTIYAAIPHAKSKISWSMPTYWKKRNLIQFAAFKNHMGIYPGPAAIEFFQDRLTGYKTSKGAVQIPYSNPLPLQLIQEIAIWCEKEYGEP